VTTAPISSPATAAGPNSIPTIIGAGKVGGSAALHSAIKQLDDQILLLDIAEGLPQGEAMELNHL